MFRKKLIWYLYPTYLLVTLISLVAVTWYSSYSFRRFYLDQTRTELNTLAHFAAEQISPVLQTKESAELNEICKKLGDAGDGQIRITVILPSGKVLGDSDEDPAIMEDHSDRPEIIDAFTKGFGWSLRLSPTLGINMMYVAIPIKEQGEAVAVVRTAIPATAIDQALSNIYVKILWGGVAIAICSAGISLVISRRISQPIVEMKQVAQRFAEGELDLRVPISAPSELGALAKALNEMAKQLYDRILTITKQRNELEAVLSSMIEGVLAVDADGHIMSVNKAAADLLKIDPTDALGRNVEEIIRNVDLHDFIQKTVESKQLVEANILLLTNGSRYFQLHGASLSDSQGHTSGAVIVLNDMTQIRRLENVRRDFVANVSHELRTPVTSIQGFVEALLEGGIQEPKQVERYLKIIAKHSNRLNTIIDDLLSLSRLEEDEEKRKISFEQVSLKPVLASAVELSSIKAAEKNITVDVVCEDQIETKVNVAFLEQAIVNLIDNAIKYSEPGGTIQVSVQRGDKEVVIAVHDEGCGIEKKHLTRIFERFYVVDKGRSRKLGGTGLGLAIVKHITQVHAGHVTVESSPGVGSTFTIHLPADE
jgi:two-component system phosphate regulon sensor histidine kinase PhoR